MEYASKGVAGTGLGLGIAGTALGVLSGGLNGLLGGANGRNTASDAAVASAASVAPIMAAALAGSVSGYKGSCSENTPVTRYELELQQQIAAKDSEIADLKSSQYTDQKLVEVYTALDRKANELRDQIRQNKDEQYAINLQQAVYNGTNTATIGCIQNQVNQLLGLTKLVIPNGSVCPGWGQVKVSPVTDAATAA